MWGLVNQSVGIGCHMNQVFGTAECLLKLGMSRGRTAAQPRDAPPDYIGGQTGEEHSELNPRQRPTYQMLDKVDAVSSLLPAS